MGFLSKKSRINSKSHAVLSIPCVCAIVVLFGPFFCDAQEAELNSEFTQKIRPILEQYCYDCHSGDYPEAGVDLEKYRSFAEVSGGLETWAKAFDEIHQKEMPPADCDQPTDQQRSDFKDWMLKVIESQSQEQSPLGRARRLSRFEFENTIRDLFRMDRDVFNNPARVIKTTNYFNPATRKMPRHVFAVSYFFGADRRHSDLSGVSTLPVDPPVEHGFSNDQDALSLSPLQMENFIEIGSSLVNSPEFPQLCGIWESMFAAKPGDALADAEARGREQIKIFLPRAFRAPIESSVLAKYQQLFENELRLTKDYTKSMKTAAVAILISPQFLYRTEFASLESVATDEELMQNFALANRLSYFLWSSMPDEILIQAAREKRLTRPGELRRQVDRMLLDRRIKALSVDFGMQWLKLQKIATVQPDKDKYPEYYRRDLPPPGISMMIEQMLLFETVMVENRSILDFIASDFSYLNRQLMLWYSMDPQKLIGFMPPNENFEDFFRVNWETEHRGGVIASGAMLLSTSTTTRTSPVYRGAWILDVIFNSPPPPAPADIPPLEPAGSQTDVHLNVREKLKLHSEDPTCASCHVKMDPLGFALEMFDTVGKWRKSYDSGDKIDASGILEGEPFDGPVRLKNVILRKKERFVQAFVEHTVKYALGRQLHYSDKPAIQKITSNVLSQDSRFQSVIREVVLSELFQQ
ncbi:MAG: DUF1592 domain-containing protein [Planctomycetota bacterium]